MEPGPQGPEDNVRLQVPVKLQKAFKLTDCEIGRYLSKLYLDHQGAKRSQLIPMLYQ